MASDLHLRKLTINDKDIFTPYLMSNKYNICDFSFSNIFMWRNTYLVDYAIHKGFLVILTSDFEGGRHFFMPLSIGKTIRGDIESVIHDMIDWAFEQKQQFKMIGITEQMARELAFLGPKFIIFPAVVWDYIYNTKDLIELKGKKFHSKRNHIHRFDSLYEYEYKELRPEYVPLCRKLLDIWCAEVESSRSITAEHRAVCEALDNFTQLGMTGGCLFIDGVLGAFTLGQPLNNEMFVIHVEKALYHYEGIYSKINQCFATRNCVAYKYINREEDLGVDGLRKAKMSYNPVFLIKKSTAELLHGHK